MFGSRAHYRPAVAPHVRNKTEVTRLAGRRSGARTKASETVSDVEMRHG